MARFLSVRAVESAKPNPQKRIEIADGAVSGLYLVVQPSGVKSWAVRYRHHGRPAKLTLGPFPRMGLADARDGAKEALRMVSEGKSPTADRVTLARLKRLPAPDGGRTFATVLDRFIASQRTKGRRSTDKVKALLDKDATAFWHHRQIDSITAADVVERIEAIVHRGSPVAASRFRAWISKLFNFAVKAQLCPSNPARLTENPVNAKARQRTRRLDDRELALAWKAADKLGYPFGTAVQLLILTGQRREEVCAAPWSEFKINNRQWIIASARAKNGVEHLVPLSDAAIDLINGLPIIAGNDHVHHDRPSAATRPAHPQQLAAQYLFTTTGTTPISGYSKWKATLDDVITELNGGKAIPHWTLHDLRRTFASGWARLRIPTEVCERQLNHVSGTFAGIVGVYQLHGYEAERDEAMQAWAEHVRAVVSGETRPPKRKFTVVAH
jgi:integrase